MVPPKGYYSMEPGLVCKLERSLYDLKQASHQRNVEFTDKLTDFGFVQSVHDHCQFTKSTSLELMVLLIYVDDILVIGHCLHDIQKTKYALDIIQDIGLTHAKPASAPFLPRLKLSEACGKLLQEVSWVTAIFEVHSPSHFILSAATDSISHQFV
ncbi:hypothetical protein Sango_1632200 [Sesamum angolense]|uniref:Reverse transcriptase Ty1/copia-type domain-containing protein n=1 Tax=Sesamum angolense TaxID=2727404 RepID=A0AAE1WK31_9LAMI|nr:hypothetical protein Sango_1632200 [Sesamum angolense]